MLFPTIGFAVFFAVVYAAHWSLRRHPQARKLFLLAASYVFYGLWNWRFPVLLAALSAATHSAAVASARARQTGARRATVAAAALLNLGLLGFVKYYGFASVNLSALWARLGATLPLPPLDIAAPVGISFIVFQSLSYLIDVARRDMPPADSWLDAALHMAFFPKLVAGPIVRARAFLPQLAAMPTLPRPDAARAAVLILGGLLKKVVLAGWLAAELVDPVYDNPELFGAADALLAVYGYAIQLYCDFSAYTDIAIGVALLLGFEFPANFDAPYLSTSVQEFWRRWHITLSTWLRDYVYIPLGGSCGSAARTAGALMLTFLLGGLWHGAGWTFVVWGLLHGVYLVVERAVYGRRGGAVRATAAMSPPARFALGALTFHLVGLTYVFFRAAAIADAGLLLRAFGRFAAPTLLTPTAGLVLAAGFASQWLDGDRAARLAAWWSARPPWAQGALAAAALTAIFAMGPPGVAPFIYFQF